MKLAAFSSEPSRLRKFCAAPIMGAALLLSGCEDPGRLSEAGAGPGGTPASRRVTGEDGLAIGHQLMAAEEYELALEAYYAAAVDLGLNADVLTGIGSANLQLGRLNQAEKVLRRALDEDDKFVPAWNNLGIVLYNRGELGEAREAFRVAYALDSGNSEEIRDNLQLLDAKLAQVVPDQQPDADFRLVRRGNGRYLLLGNN
ncbi:tetratricopeptide repeat protein [Halovulum sp. GXIMD14794]